MRSDEDTFAGKRQARNAERDGRAGGKHGGPERGRRERGRATRGNGEETPGEGRGEAPATDAAGNGERGGGTCGSGRRAARRRRWQTRRAAGGRDGTCSNGGAGRHVGGGGACACGGPRGRRRREVAHDRNEDPVLEVKASEGELRRGITVNCFMRAPPEEVRTKYHDMLLNIAVKRSRRIVMLVDSGACDHVIPKDKVPEVAVTRGKAAQEEVFYLAADGG